MTKFFIEAVKGISFILILYVCMWGIRKLFADSVTDYEVIKPKEGVECVVVKRTFNTSVDCWKEL